MNFIQQPTHDDFGTLDELEQSNYANHFLELNLVRRAYGNYLRTNGSAQQIIALGNLSNVFQRKFKNLYKSSRACMKYIKELREESLACCPMCGSFDVGTLDHVLPKDIFIEFSIYSKNLVPCCHGCNGKKGTTYRNANGGRVLHPYFDTFLRDRLVYTSITSNNGSYNRPTLNVMEISPTHPNRTEIQFHIEKVVKKTRILNRQIAIWYKIKNRPNLFFSPLPIDMAEFEIALNQKIADFDEEFESCNNWKSMLFYGVLQSNGTKTYLLNLWHR